jgi:hypothetical protein
MAILRVLMIILILVSPIWAGPQTVRDFTYAAGEGVLGGYTVPLIDAIYDNGLGDTNTHPLSGISGQDEYPFLEDATLIQVSSSDNDDTASIKIEYLDENWQVGYMDLNLSGNTVVDGTVAIRVRQAWIENYGEDYAEPRGTIYVYPQGTPITNGVPDSNEYVLLTIKPEEGRSHSAVWSTALGEILMVRTLELSAEGKVNLWYRQYGENQMLLVATNSREDLFLPAIPEKADVWLTGQAVDGSTPFYLKVNCYYRKK